MKYKILDTYCGAGGASEGYFRAGFEVVGVDLFPQPHYPFEFRQADALEFIEQHGHEYDAIHASPPCQAHSTMTNGLWKDRLDGHPRLIEPTRELFRKLAIPYVIENVPGSPLINPFMLCGTMFKLGVNGSQLRRHRYFETNWLEGCDLFCEHIETKKYENGRRIPSTIGVWGHAGGSSNRDNLVQFSTQDRKDAMGIQWMNGKELSEAIPPVYTEYIGRILIKLLDILK